MWSDDFEEPSKEPSRKRRKLDLVKIRETVLSNNEPNGIEDLVTHTKKTAEVKGWLEWASSCLSPQILLITGPTGSAKTATLKVVAKSLNILVQEWINPVDKNEYQKDEWAEFDLDSKNYREPKQLEKFESFALRGSRYQTLFSTNQRCILLVEDFPNYFLWNPSAFFEFLTVYKKNARCPVVFIITDDDKINLGQKLFPNQIRDSHSISNIKFNCASNTSLVKVLTKRAPFLDKESIKQIAHSCHGDVRTAISSLQFLITDSRKQKKNTTLSKDITADIFQALGRVLYPKKLEQPSPQGKIFVHDVFGIASHYDNTFLSMLQENFLGMFSSLNGVVNACQILSDCDVLGYGGECNGLMGCAAVVCVTGLMLANTNKTQNRQFKPFIRSRWSGKMQTLTAETVRPYPQLNATRRSINLELIPYLKFLPGYSRMLTRDDADRLPTQAIIHQPVATFKAPPPPTVSCNSDDEIVIEEFED